MGDLEHADTELYGLSTLKWKKSSPYFNYRQIYSFSTFFYQDKFYVTGGKTKSEILSEVATFDVKTEKWSQLGRLKFPRFDHKIDVIGNKLFVIGGSKTPEYCDLTDFACSKFTDESFQHDNSLALYAFYPSQCELGTDT